MALANMNRSNVIHCMPFSLNCFQGCCMCTSETGSIFGHNGYDFLSGWICLSGCKLTHMTN